MSFRASVNESELTISTGLGSCGSASEGERGGSCSEMKDESWVAPWAECSAVILDDLAIVSSATARRCPQDSVQCGDIVIDDDVRQLGA